MRDAMKTETEESKDHVIDMIDKSLNQYGLAVSLTAQVLVDTR